MGGERGQDGGGERGGGQSYDQTTTPHCHVLYTHTHTHTQQDQPIALAIGASQYLFTDMPVTGFIVQS